MSHCHPCLSSWANNSLFWIAEHIRTPWLTPIMTNFSRLGEEAALLFTVALAYWLWNQRYSKFLTYAVFTTLLTNLALKGWIKECRPPTDLWLVPLNMFTFSFPSGHAQVVTPLWFGLAYYARSAFLSPLMVFIGLMVALSRPYVGAHYLHDIGVGILLGSLIFWLFIYFEQKNYAFLPKLNLWQRSILLLIPLIACNLWINENGKLLSMATAGCFGFWLGAQWEDKILGERAQTPLGLTLLRAFIGTIGTLILWKGMAYWRATLTPELSAMVRYGQYFLLSIWITLGTSWFSLLWERRTWQLVRD